MTETNRGAGKEKEKRKRALKSDRGTSSPRLIFQLFLPNVSVILQWTILYEGIHNDHKTSELLKRKVGRHRHSFFPAVRLAVYGFACCTESCIEDVHLSELFSHQYTKSKSNTTHDDNCCSVYLMTSSINCHQQIEMYDARFLRSKNQFPNENIITFDKPVNLSGRVQFIANRSKSCTFCSARFTE